MDKLATLQAERGIAADKLRVLTESDDKFDEAMCKSLEDQVMSLDKRIAAIQRSRGIQSALARPDRPHTEAFAADPEQLYVKYGRLFAFKGPHADACAYKVGQFLRATLFGREDGIAWCRENGVSLLKAQAEGVNSAGGVLVPEEMMAAIIVLRETYGVFRRECRVVPMGRDTLNWPRRTGGLTAYFVGENSTLTESQAAFDNVNLTAKKLACLTKLSTELAEDAVINIADFIVNEVAYAFASKEDDCGFNGDGTSTYGGITGLTTKAVNASYAGSTVTAASGHITYDTIDAKDLGNLIGRLPQYAQGNAKFYISQTGFGACFERLISSAGGNTIATLDGSIVYRYLGFPISISQKLPLVTTTLANKAMMFFGDLTLSAAMGERRGVTIRRLDERFADADQIGIMGTERFDINIHDMGDATNAGPIVAMLAPAS